MIKKEVVRPNGEIYMEAWLDTEPTPPRVRFRFESSGYTVAMDPKVAPYLEEFFREVKFYNFCKASNGSNTSK